MPLAAYRKSQRPMGFSRDEIKQILAIYSSHVISGDWKDYALDQRPERAMFAVYRDSRAWPLYLIVKNARATNRRPRYQLFKGPAEIRRGKTLNDILAEFKRTIKLVSG